MENERKLDPDKRSVFYLRAPRASVVARIQDSQSSMTSEGGFLFRTAQAALEMVQEGLARWENVKDERGQDVPFIAEADGRPSSETLDLLPPERVKELARAVENVAKLSEDEVKN